MKYSVIPSAQAVIKHCKARGIANIVISPGSRNAPLTLGFTSDSFFNCFSIVDERSAAFFALGIAQQLKKPVVVLCTSGSALLNFYPAVAEAFYSDIPLVVISADRPPYKIDIGDGQTIRQDKVFDRHIGYFAQLKQDLVHAAQELEQWGILPESSDPDQLQGLQQEVQTYNDEQLNEAFFNAFERQSPIHINVPFEEPLYGLQEKESYEPFVEIKNINDNNQIQDFDELLHLWNASNRKMLIIGVQNPETFKPEILEALAEDPSLVVLTETTSNLPHPEFINSIDSIVAPVELSANSHAMFEELKPDILLTMGGLIVSKKIKAFLRNFKPKYHWHVDKRKAYNTFQVPVQHIAADPGYFLDALIKERKAMESDFKLKWRGPDDDFKICREAYLKDIDFSDMLAFDYIIKAIPASWQVQLANSSTVRYSQLFDMDPSLSVFCNRGTSGIDGSTSTAVGAAYYSDQPTVLISGDLSFLYDINGLWNEYVRKDFRIILINNGGGGIFRILPGKKEDSRFEQFFETVHHAQIDKICSAYGLDHQLVADGHSLQKALKTFFTPGEHPKLLEVKTPRTLNDRILLQYFEFISSKLYS